MPVIAKVNGKAVSFSGETDTPLLWAIREELGMTGTKFGCGIAACGACSVHIDGSARLRANPSPRSKGCRQAMARFMRCKRRGSRIRCRNAAIASRVN